MTSARFLVVVALAACAPPPPPPAAPDAGEDGPRFLQDLDGIDAAALSNDVVAFRRHDADDHDVVAAQDVFNGEKFDIRGFANEGGARLTSIAVAPGRRAIAFAGVIDDFGGPGIWLATSDGDELYDVLPPDDETTDILGLAWDPDDETLWYTRIVGDEATIHRVRYDGSGHEEHAAANAGCAQAAMPAPRTGGRALVNRGACSGEPGGLYLLDGDALTPVIPADGAILPAAFTPRWLADNTGFLFVGTSDWDVDGDDVTDIADGTGLVLANTAGSNTAALLPEVPGRAVRTFAFSPDQDFIALCARTNDGAADDLFVADLTGSSLQLFQITQDGISCDPTW